MKIFVLEDSDSKFNRVAEVINKRSWLTKPKITRASCFMDAQRILERDVYDLLILDLVAPLRAQGDPEDLTNDISSLRIDELCLNRATPAVALTQFEARANDGFNSLNKLGITIVTYDPSSEDWHESISRAVEHSQPPITYDYVIICALRKERDAYDDLGFQIGDEVIIDDLSCKSITISGLSGIIVVPTRMGLVSSAIACTKVIERFRPKVIAMSGICAGFDNAAKIYDVIVPERCYQHDSGKWTKAGFVLEPYQAALENSTRLEIDRIINRKGFCDEMVAGIEALPAELPEDQSSLSCTVKLAVSSSGSSVVASNTQSKAMKDYHRKGTAFEMEAYAVYDSAVSSCHKPAYFSAKCVVDNGGTSKGDAYHRVACILSAKVCGSIIVELLNKK